MHALTLTPIPPLPPPHPTPHTHTHTHTPTPTRTQSTSLIPPPTDTQTSLQTRLYKREVNLGATSTCVKVGQNHINIRFYYGIIGRNIKSLYTMSLYTVLANPVRVLRLARTI